MSFENPKLIKSVHIALANKSYAAPTPFQQQAIVPMLDRIDLLGCAQTGKGKTAAFAVPISQILSGTAFSFCDKVNIEMKCAEVRQELEVKKNK